MFKSVENMQLKNYSFDSSTTEMQKLRYSFAKCSNLLRKIMREKPDYQPRFSRIHQQTFQQKGEITSIPSNF